RRHPRTRAPSGTTGRARRSDVRPRSGLWRRFLRPYRFGTHLLDGVPQLAAEDDLGVARPGFQALVEHQLAVLVELDQAQFAQLLDEAPEQALVEELRRGRRVQQAQALRGELAQAFEFA